VQQRLPSGVRHCLGLFGHVEQGRATCLAGCGSGYQIKTLDDPNDAALICGAKGEPGPRQQQIRITK